MTMDSGLGVASTLPVVQDVGSSALAFLQCSRLEQTMSTRYRGLNSESHTNPCRTAEGAGQPSDEKDREQVRCMLKMFGERRRSIWRSNLPLGTAGRFRAPNGTSGRRAIILEQIDAEHGGLIWFPSRPPAARRGFMDSGRSPGARRLLEYIDRHADAALIWQARKSLDHKPNSRPNWSSFRFRCNQGREADHCGDGDTCPGKGHSVRFRREQATSRTRAEWQIARQSQRPSFHVTFLGLTPGPPSFANHRRGPSNSAAAGWAPSSSMSAHSWASSRRRGCGGGWGWTPAATAAEVRPRCRIRCMFAEFVRCQTLQVVDFPWRALHELQPD